MREDDSADEGILSEAFSEYQEEHEHTAISEKHNSEFYDFIRIDDHHLCSSERVGSEEDPQRRPHRSEREERSIPREPISEEDSQDDPLLRLQSQRRRRRGSLRRNSRIQSRYKVEYEEDGTFLVPPVEKSRSWKDRLLRGCRATRKSPRLLHRKVISYKLSDLFGTEVSDQEEGRHRDERDGQVDRDEYGNRDGHRDRDEYRDRDGRRDRDEGYDRPLTNADQNVGPSSLIERIAGMDECMKCFGYLFNI